jgi:hypothetical protein
MRYFLVVAGFKRGPLNIGYVIKREIKTSTPFLHMSASCITYQHLLGFSEVPWDWGERTGLIWLGTGTGGGLL